MTSDDAMTTPAAGGHERPIYLDFNATTPVDPRVAEEVMLYMTQEFGNAGSRTHTYGQRAKERVNRAREEVADLFAAKPEEVIFTSGATESDNLAILGLEEFGRSSGKRHIISTTIEHKAVLEPLEHVRRLGFDVTLIAPSTSGRVSAEAIAAALRPDTLLVSCMAVNNETGVIQPIGEIAQILVNHPAFFHVDAAQAVGKVTRLLQNPRIDLIAMSGHKIGAPKGIGALVMRRRGYKRPPLKPLLFGGGQERGLRPGTLPVPLIAGLGTAAALAAKSNDMGDTDSTTKRELLAALEPLGAQVNGDLDHSVATTLNVSIPGIDSEAAIVALKEVAAISNGSACTSNRYEPSHVLLAAGLSPERVSGALRISWSPDVAVPSQKIADRLAPLIRSDHGDSSNESA